MKQVLLVGGGTAGHVEPALAVGRWLVQHDQDLKVEFLGTRHGIESDLLAKAGFTLNCIAKVPLPRKISVELLTFPFRFSLSLLQSIALVRRFDLVIGFGGYVSASAYIAAWLLRKPILIHEANAVPGWSNKLAVKFATEVAVAFESVKKRYPAWSQAIHTGMPLRKEIADITRATPIEKAHARASLISDFGLTPELPILLAFGGSQGSVAMNRAINQFSHSKAASKVQIIHAVGGKNLLPAATASYKPLSYIYNMAQVYMGCDLVISRSGAVSCAEIEAIHKFAVLVPLAIGNGEQNANAQDLLDIGAATICANSDFTSSWLESNIDELLARANKFNNTDTLKSWQNADEAIGKIALSIMER
jgi:UDP-N-acetylglucosamine--N-acetylmuramyl-(pentapeptide) pyrophosphoryl-undecaprenol N-acetylglucosamine transferase